MTAADRTARGDAQTPLQTRTGRTYSIGAYTVRRGPYPYWDVHHDEDSLSVFCTETSLPTALAIAARNALGDALGDRGWDEDRIESILEAAESVLDDLLTALTRGEES